MAAKQSMEDIRNSFHDVIADQKTVTKNSLDGKANAPPVSKPLAMKTDLLPFGVVVSSQPALNAEKRSTFEITRVVNKAGEDAESTDDIDDVTNTEEMSSELHEAPRNADVECDRTSVETIHSPCCCDDQMSPQLQSPHLHLLQVTHSTHSTANDANSRFKIVKIKSNEPLKKGRWTCSDFKDPVPSERTENAGKSDDTGSGNVGVPSSLYFIPVLDDPSRNQFSAIVYANGHPILEPNPLNPQNENIYYSLQPASQSTVPAMVRPHDDTINHHLLPNGDTEATTPPVLSQHTLDRGLSSSPAEVTGTSKAGAQTVNSHVVTEAQTDDNATSAVNIAGDVTTPPLVTVFSGSEIEDRFVLLVIILVILSEFFN